MSADEDLMVALAAQLDSDERTAIAERAQRMLDAS